MDDQDDSWNESVHSCNFLAIATNNMIKFNCVIHGEERDKCNFQIHGTEGVLYFTGNLYAYGTVSQLSGQ